MAAPSVKMETNSSKPSSDALLSCGSDPRGFSERLLLNPAARGPCTERVPRSRVLQRLHSFLPQMAAANERLQRQIDACGAPEDFHIDNVEQAPRVIEMDVALVELDESGSEDWSQDSDQDQDQDQDQDSDESEGGEEVTENNMKLPGEKKRRAQIEILQQSAE